MILGSRTFGPPGSMKNEPFVLTLPENTVAGLQADLAQATRENDLLLATNQRLMREAEEDRGAIRWLKARCVAYSEAVTILVECDHGDEATCRCRDRAAAITAEMLKDRHAQAATIARAHGQPGGAAMEKG